MLCGCYSPCCSSCYPSNCTTTSTTTSTTTTTTICPDPEVCDQVYDLECVEYTGQDEECFDIITGDYIDSVITQLFGLLQFTTTTCVRPDRLLSYSIFDEISFDDGATTSGITDSIESVCAAYNELIYNPSSTLYSFLAQTTKLLVGEPMYSGDSTDCTPVENGFYLVYDGLYYMVVHVVDGIIEQVEDIITCTTTTTSTSTTTTTTVNPCLVYTLYNNDPDNDATYSYDSCIGIGGIPTTGRVEPFGCVELTEVTINTLIVENPLVDIYEGAICDTLTTTTTTIP